jgi:hypothetical protein
MSNISFIPSHNLSWLEHAQDINPTISKDTLKDLIKYGDFDSHTQSSLASLDPKKFSQEIYLYKEMSNKLLLAQKEESFHKKNSIALLIISVSCIALAIILGIFVNPLFALIGLGSLITVLCSICYTSPFELDPYPVYQELGIPIASELLYIYKAFQGNSERLSNEKNRLGKEIKEKLSLCNKLLEKKEIIQCNIQNLIKIKPPTTNYNELSESTELAFLLVQLEKLNKFVEETKAT